MSEALLFGITGTAALVAGGVLLVVLVWLVATYNRLVSLRLGVRNAWAQIEVQLKRRYDLIPNLVETVKGYAGHEKQTLESVIAARNQAASASGPVALGAAEGMLSSALRQLFAVAEAYPNLKANENFQQLQGELAATENQVSGVRQRYNNSVQEYNTAIVTFPAMVVATLFAFREEEFFEITAPEQREAPKVKFT